MKTETLELTGQEGAIQHRSGQVYCSARQEPAVVSVISRADGHAPVCFVLWCSLRAIGECDEQCLRR